MKKLMLIACFFIPFLACYSQEPEVEKENQSSTKAYEFSTRAGSLIQEKRYFLTDIDPSSELKSTLFYVVCYENLLTKEKVACLRITTTMYSGLTRKLETATGTLDADEVGTCLESLTYIKNNVIGQKPIEPTDCSYVSRDLMKIGIATDKKKEWVPIIRADKWQPLNILNLKIDDFDKLILNLSLAKSKIEELVK